MTKIEALEKTIYNLENDVYEYNWHSANSCNCGILAKTILGTQDSVYELGYRLTKNPKVDGVFSRDYETCRATGEKLPKIFRGLYETGFTYDELLNLEYLKDSKIVSKMPYIADQLWPYLHKDNLIAYLKAWVSILKEQESPKQPKSEKTIIRYVAVPDSITKQTKELIEN